MKKASIALVDIETSGLEKQKHAILEIGIVLLDIDLTIIDQFESVIADDMSVKHLDWLEQMADQEPSFRGQEPWKSARYVHEMHQKNGLAEEIRSTVQAGEKYSLAETSHRAVDWLRSNNIGKDLNLLPMTGSSIMFDRGFIEAQMPLLNDEFHYRNIDVSSLKGLVDLYRADLVELRRTDLSPAKTHRVMSDCMDSIDELRFYLENLFQKASA